MLEGLSLPTVSLLTVFFHFASAILQLPNDFLHSLLININGFLSFLMYLSDTIELFFEFYILFFHLNLMPLLYLQDHELKFIYFNILLIDALRGCLQFTVYLFCRLNQLIVYANQSLDFIAYRRLLC